MSWLAATRRRYRPRRAVRRGAQRDRSAPRARRAVRARPASAATRRSPSGVSRAPRPRSSTTQRRAGRALGRLEHRPGGPVGQREGARGRDQAAERRDRGQQRDELARPAAHGCRRRHPGHFGQQSTHGFLVAAWRPLRRRRQTARAAGRPADAQLCTFLHIWLQGTAARLEPDARAACQVRLSSRHPPCACPHPPMNTFGLAFAEALRR